jgi:transforming growth factor-beta-induced protein
VKACLIGNIKYLFLGNEKMKKNLKAFNQNIRGLSKLIIVATLVVVIVVAAVVGYAYMSSTNQTKDIVETTKANGSFSTLVTALTAANLVDTLKGTGPFTVFAPTDAAFNALPSGLLNELLANSTALTQVLKFHVVSGKLTGHDLASLNSVTSLQGEGLPVTIVGGITNIGRAKVTQTDIVCSNGVIHVIDAVLIPSGIMNIIQALKFYGFSTLITAIQTADLTSTMEGAGPFTVFAPTNAAFTALPAGTLDSLLADKTALANLVTYHVVSGKLMAANVATQTTLTTLQGSTLAITTTGGTKVNGANIIMGDIECSNGVIHLIDAVLTPP